MVSIDRSISERKIVDIVSKLKVGERLLEETSRAESDLQIVRAQEGECREVSIHNGFFLLSTRALYAALSHYRVLVHRTFGFFIQPNGHFGLKYQCNRRDSLEQRQVTGLLATQLSTTFSLDLFISHKEKPDRKHCQRHNGPRV